MVHDWHPCLPDRFIQHAAEEQRTGHGPDSWNLSVNHSMNNLNTPGCSWVIKAVKMSKCVKSLLKTFLSRKAANSSTGTSIKKNPVPACTFHLSATNTAHASPKTRQGRESSRARGCPVLPRCCWPHSCICPAKRNPDTCEQPPWLTARGANSTQCKGREWHLPETLTLPFIPSRCWKRMLWTERN